MPLYITHRSLSGATPDTVVAVQHAERLMSEQFTAQGRPVRYIRSLFVPAESHCMCLFVAASAKLVQEVNEAAGIPFTRIVEAIEAAPT
jgi:hypothetical protein